MSECALEVVQSECGCGSIGGFVAADEFVNVPVLIGFNWEEVQTGACFPSRSEVKLSAAVQRVSELDTLQIGEV